MLEPGGGPGGGGIDIMLPLEPTLGADGYLGGGGGMDIMLFIWPCIGGDMGGGGGRGKDLEGSFPAMLCRCPP